MSKYCLALFAGGLGSRLLNSENLPKPLVDINGISLLSRIILQYSSTGMFDEFVLLTCLNDDLFRKLISIELPDLNIRFCNESVRSGRVGALSHYLTKNYSKDSFFIANSDTLFHSLSPSRLLQPLQTPADFSRPIVYLASPDISRNDYFSIDNEKFSNMQNSGLAFLSRKWFIEQTRQYSLLKDIDDILFNNNDYPIFHSLNTHIYDAGTPDRLALVRSVFK